MLAVVLAVGLVACTPPSTPTPITMPTSIAPCFPESVFTAADMRARVDCHPDAYKMQIDEDTVVLFAFPDPLLDWVGPIFVIHIPSVSEVVLSTEGNILFEDYKSSAGRAAIEQVLNHQEWRTGILDRAQEIEASTKP